MKYIDPMTADLRVCHNNGTMAVRVCGGERLTPLVNTVFFEGREIAQVWVFKHSFIWHAHGVDNIDHHARGLCSGTIEEGNRFLGLCEALGLNIDRRTNFHVPLSNGQRAIGYERGGTTATMWDYEDFERLACRIDLPSPTKLVQTLCETDPSQKREYLQRYFKWLAADLSAQMAVETEQAKVTITLADLHGSLTASVLTIADTLG